MSLVEIVNQTCCPTKPLVSEQECINYLRELKILAIQPTQVTVDQFAQISSPMVQSENGLQQILYEYTGQANKNPSSADLQKLKQVLVRVRENSKALPNQSIAQALRQQNVFLAQTQNLLHLINAKPHLLESNMTNAVETLKIVRQKLGAQENMSLIDMLLASGHKSDFLQFGRIIPLVFGPTENFPQTCEQICSFFEQRMEIFEQSFSIKFINALQKAFQMPKFTETPAIDFLSQKEVAVYSALILKYFQIETDKPLQFIAYLENLIQQMNTRAQMQKQHLLACMLKILNEQVLGECSKMYLQFSGSNQDFASVNDFVVQFNTQIAKVNKQELKIGELCEFAVQDFLSGNAEAQKKLILDKTDQEIFDKLPEEEKKLDGFRQKLPVVVPYYTQIFISKSQNLEIEQNVLAPFQALQYLVLDEQKSELDNSQPLFALSAVLNLLNQIFVDLKYPMKGLMNKIIAYAQTLTSRVQGWFQEGKKQSMFYLKKEFKDFNKKFVSQFNPFSWIFQQFLTSMKIKLQFKFVNKDTPSELTEFLMDQMAVPNVNIYEIYTQVIIPLLKANGNTPIIPYLGVLFKAYMNQFLQHFMKSCFNDSAVFENPNNLGQALGKFENRLKKETKTVLDLFMYTDDVLKTVNYCIFEEQLAAIQKFNKALGFEKLKKEQQITLFFNIHALVEKMKIDLVVAQTEKTAENFIDFVDLMIGIYQSDATLNLQKQDYHQEFTRMLARNAENLIQQKQNKFFYLQKSFEEIKAQTGQSTVTAVFEKIDPTKATKWDEFLKEMALMMQAGKMSMKQEKLFKVFEQRLIQYYIICKKCYGNQMKNFGDMFKLMEGGENKISAGVLAENELVVEEELPEGQSTIVEGQSQIAEKVAEKVVEEKAEEKAEEKVAEEEKPEEGK